MAEYQPGKHKSAVRQEDAALRRLSGSDSPFTFVATCGTRGTVLVAHIGRLPYS